MFEGPSSDHSQSATTNRPYGLYQVSSLLKHWTTSSIDHISGRRVGARCSPDTKCFFRRDSGSPVLFPFLLFGPTPIPPCRSLTGGTDTLWLE